MEIKVLFVVDLRDFCFCLDKGDAVLFLQYYAGIKVRLIVIYIFIVVFFYQTPFLRCENFELKQEKKKLQSVQSQRLYAF